MIRISQIRNPDLFVNRIPGLDKKSSILIKKGKTIECRLFQLYSERVNHHSCRGG
jgi:hypothetical protein